ncbi:MAG: hypothetical protein ACRDSZ_06290 [Pseudonocardiaceae bacterium]
MTTGTNTGDDLSCYSCAHRARPGDHYCERCGSALGTLSVSWHPATGNGQPHADQGPVGAAPTLDGTTRYLCAAAHLDEEFCDEAIAEFLVEPVRAIPPSPGVDSAAVLREAVAAQTRRRIRDGLLLALLALLALVNLATVIFWAVAVAVAVALQAIGASRNRRMAAGMAQLLATNAGNSRRMVAGVAQLLATGAGRNRRNFAVLVVVIWVALGLLLPLTVLSFAAAAGLNNLVELSTLQLLPDNSWLTLLISGLMLLVLIVDEFTVAKLMTSSFRRDRFDPDAGRAPSEWERLARCLGHSSFRTELHRVARSDESSQAAGQADVVVYRGYDPFIGAGEQVDRHVIALPLEPSEDDTDGNPAPISVNDLHRHVTEALAALRSSSSLSPGRRLEQLRLREQVLMPADRLLFNRTNQLHSPVLPDLSHPPLAHLPLGAARALAEDPLEWARYYSCFRVESWDRDLTTSCYLHIGTDQRMLYLEWTYCVLLPVSEHYRSVDRPADSPWTVFGRSLAELVTLPASVIRRLRSVFRRRTVLVQRAGEVVPARYGAAQSLRELAADTETQAYFQEADVERYISIIDRTLFRAVGQFLEQRGYSVVEFTKMTESVVNNFIQGDVIGSALGKGSTVSGSSVRVNAGRAGRTKGAK